MICSVLVFADRTNDLFLQCRYRTLRKSDAFLFWFFIFIGLCFFLSKYSTDTSSLAYSSANCSLGDFAYLKTSLLRSRMQNLISNDGENRKLFSPHSFFK